MELDDDAAWSAVLARDAGADGRFVYAVGSTGIYCRPSCPSRRPRRRGVTFFATADDAERAAFRACRRCDPRGRRAPAAELIARACRALDDSDGPLTLAALGGALGVSPFHLQRTFKRVVGVTPKEYAAARRVARLKASLPGAATVTEAVYEAGYGSGSRVYERPLLGMTPATYRSGGRGARIAFTTAATPLGRLLVAATAHGVCAVSLGSGDRALERALRAEYPRATVERDGRALGPWVAAIVASLDGDRRGLALPLDVQATAFQRRVWQALREIPRGETRSYAELADAIGAPTAARAVARACSTNPVALLIPCHRVVRGDGAVGGYRWGAARKRRLLDGERE
jgi:AraC family transcriptional regulator of adaptative response/methylated-DNA-[protein]-cysteine methyltransferase